MKWLKRLVLMFVLCVVLPLTAMAAIEGTASAGLLISSFAQRTSPGNFRQATYDSLTGWIGIPNSSNPNFFGPGGATTTNGAGMRIHRPVIELEPGQQRIVCSGDSFTYGSGVSDGDTFCAQLENEIPGVRALNMAQPGFGIDQAYLWYKRDGSKTPHHVHVFAFIWHDFERMALTEFTGYPKPKLTLENGVLKTVNVPVPQWSGPSRFTNSSELLAQTRIVQFLRERTRESDSVKLARVDAAVWDVAEAVFADLAAVNAANHSKLVLTYLPALPDLAPGPYDHRRERLAAFCKKAGIAFLDLVPAIRTIPADTLDWMFITPNALPVNGSSGHYTPLGHKWVANQIATGLRSLHVIGDSARSATGR